MLNIFWTISNLGIANFAVICLSWFYIINIYNDAGTGGNPLLGVQVAEEPKEAIANGLNQSTFINNYHIILTAYLYHTVSQQFV